MTRRARQGQTLVEMLMSSGLLLLVVGGAVWALIYAFRLNKTVDGELDVVERVVLQAARIAGEAALSRGLVRFTPAGETATKDGLLVRGNRIIVYELEPRGLLRRAVYGSTDLRLLTEAFMGRFSSFQLIAIERGLHLSLEGTTDPSIKKSGLKERTVEMSTGVRALSW